jgi:hypothetical protein
MTDFKIGDKVQIDPALVNSGAREAPRGIIGTVTLPAYAYGGSVGVKWATYVSWQQPWELVHVVEPPKKLEARHEN